MTAYFIRRFLLIVPTFLGITILIFVITRFVPGGPIERIIAQAQQQALEGGSAAILMILVFASYWEFFPLGELVSENFEIMSFWEKALDLAWHSLMPLSAYLIRAFSFMTFLMKNNILMDNRPAVSGRSLESAPSVVWGYLKG